MNRVSFLKSLINPPGGVLLLASLLGVALVAWLAYRSSATGLSDFITSMRGSGCFSNGMMVNQLIAEAQQAYYQRIASYMWLAGGAGVVLSLTLGWLLSRQTVRPLDEMALAARRMASGDLDQKVTARGYAEVNDLAASFNHMADALRHDRDLRRNMAADIAHELRTPLSILQGNIEGIQDGVLPASAETLELLHTETMELSRLVEDLRTLSLAEARQLHFDLQPVDLTELSRHVADEFRGRAAQHDVKIELATPPSLPAVTADPSRISQVLRNLLDNALRYSPEGGVIRVALSDASGFVQMAVSDQGPGISEEHLPFIFERFYRVDRSRARATGGSGLGLAIVKQLVESQGGTINRRMPPPGTRACNF
jgi:signal transduction histidine kinase